MPATPARRPIPLPARRRRRRRESTDAAASAERLGSRPIRIQVPGPFAIALAIAFAFTVALGLPGCERPPDVGSEPAPPPGAGAPVDPELAAAGEQWYRFRGCLACHTIGGGRGLGPDLAGVTERRDYPWFLGIVMAPDSMFQHDPVARALLEEYRTPMPETGVSEAQARAIFEYLRLRDGRPEAAR